MNLAHVVARLANMTITVEPPPAQGYDDNGVAVFGTVDDEGAPVPPVTSSVRACVQPLRGRELQMLPEGTNQTEARAVFVAGPLPVDSRLTLPSGERFKVMSAEPWDDVAGYTRAIAVKLR